MISSLPREERYHFAKRENLTCQMVSPLPREERYHLAIRKNKRDYVKWYLPYLGLIIREGRQLLAEGRQFPPFAKQLSPLHILVQEIAH